MNKERGFKTSLETNKHQLQLTESLMKRWKRALKIVIEIK